MATGKLIVFEGIDGSGKSTQFKLLTDRLKAEGRDFRQVTFPRYANSSSALLRSYLNGEFAQNPEDVSAYAASTFFFVDRYASYKTDWGAYYQNGGLVLCDRYTTSNAIHQGAKLPRAELPAFLDWLYDFEFDKMELPKPDTVLYMDTTLEACLAQMARRQSETQTHGDIHETHTDYLRACLETGAYAADHLGWQKIRCTEGGAVRPIADIQEDIYKVVKGVLDGWYI
ncbi:MAG: dTMP kinase [Oscillospiraceae bacterium]|jgi:dTMP kinase